MARFFFDIREDGKLRRDDEGTELESISDVRKEAQTILPAIAFDEIPKDGDQKTYVVLVTDDDGQAIYSATLHYAGSWLLR